MGRLRGSVGLVSNFGSGHDLAFREFKPQNGLFAVCTEPLRILSQPLFLCLSPACIHVSSLSVCLSLSLPIKKTLKTFYISSLGHEIDT